MSRYPHWTFEPCLHSADLDRRLRLAAQRWLDDPRMRAAWTQHLAVLRQDPELGKDLEGVTVDEALTNGVVAGMLLEQGLLQMGIGRGDEPARPARSAPPPPDRAS